jgi:hypothetical protein
LTVLFLDFVEAANAEHGIGIALLSDEGSTPPATPAADLRFVDPRALHALIARHAAPTIGFVDVDDETPAREKLASERIIDLLEWCVLYGAARAERIERVVVAEHVGLRGSGRGDLGRLPGGDDLQVVFRRAVRQLPPMTPEVPLPARFDVIPFGVPTTPKGLTLARLLASVVLVEGFTAAQARYSWLEPTPVPEMLTEVRRLGSVLCTRPLQPMVAAAALTRLSRMGGLAGVVGTELARAALNWLANEIRRVAFEPATAALYRALTGEMMGIADARQGDYEACEHLLEALWDHPDDDGRPLVDHVLAGDPWGLAQAHVVRGRIANHRGDYGCAARAFERARAAGRSENSLRMRLLLAEAATLQAVAAQNRWPFDPQADDEASAMAEAAESLRALVERLMAAEAGAADTDPASPPDDRLDLGALGAEPIHQAADPLLGAALGTLGRTLAFLGHHDEAVQRLLEARSCFAGRLDRVVNATYLAHVELDRPEGPDRSRLNLILDCVIPRSGRSAAACIARLQTGDAAFRFSANVILKALAAGYEIEDCPAEEWVDALRATGSRSLLGLLRSIGSHPTELVARHAAELLLRFGARDAATRWFDLGIGTAMQGGATMQRLGRFTERLSHGYGPDQTAPRGSVDNPCYEYR